MNIRSKLSLILLAAAMISPWAAVSRLHAQASFALRKIVSDDSGGADATIAPDGKSFVTSLWRNGNWQLWVYDIEATRWRQVTNHPSDNFEGDWSPDGKRIVFTSTRTGNNNIFLVSLDSGETKQITDSPYDAEYPKFSPDGHHIVYTNGKWNERKFYVADLADGSSRPITDKPGKAGACSFHPQGALVVCHSYDSGTGHLSLQSTAAGAAPLELTHGDVWDYKPTVSPDGQWLAFSRSQDGPSRIWVMPFPAGDAVPLNPLDYDSDDRWPTWDRAGDIFFHRLSERGLAVKVLDRKTGAVKTVVGSEESPGQASLDPSSTQVVYGAVEGKKQVLRIRSLDGKTARTLPLGVEATFPRWSPNGKDIAFTCWSGERWDICTVHPDGTGFKNWTDKIPGWRDLRDPIDWSPDSSEIVFHASTQPYEANLYVLSLNDGSTHNLTNDSWFSESPSWSPDGKSIIFMSTRGGNWTWGFFRLSLENSTFSTVAGPDYTQRNFPRANRQGDLVSSMYNSKDGREYIAESHAGGTPTIVSACEPWARWPSYSSDGRLIVYTQLEHKVEYWIAEHVTGPASPLQHQTAASNVSSATSKLDEQPLGNLGTLHLHGLTTSTPTGGSSPVDMYHR
jgi:TolB protein